MRHCLEKKQGEQTKEMSQKFGVLAALGENWSFVLSIHIRWLQPVTPEDPLLTTVGTCIQVV